MDAISLYNELKQYCDINENEANKIKYQKYFKDSIDAYGLSAPQVYQKTKEILKRKELDIVTITECLSKYLIKGKYEEISLGLILLDGLSKEFTKDTFVFISSLFKDSITNWAHADTLGMFILPKFLMNGIVSINDFAPWMQSDYKFQRRCVPVTFIKAMKKDKNCLHYIKFVEPLMLEPIREVHQGVGWFLREAWKIEKEPVETFLLKYKETAPRLIFQYACEKMTKEDKLRFRRSI